ncbi:DUF4143 domain-containing protein [uncultured Acetobacterium sp.]|uniref:ATP-binding protein n=1 Tax=uncultured Acetobacterium sp. TaxID=217139 RepID=UPI0025EA0FC4|nr:DUF4143 domain-containing protein [uncultured Acetobacterium sp.]
MEPAQDYVDSIVQFDVSRVDGIEKNPNKMFALLRSLSRNISTEANYSVLIKDMEGGENESISRPTIQSYLNVLQRLFVVEDLEAWNPSIRSATPLRVSPKRQFVDPSIGIATLGITHERLLSDFNAFGYLFESLCIRDLRIYAEALGGKVYHYRDKSGLECDAVVVLRDGRWGAVEIKLGSNEFDKAGTTNDSIGRAPFFLNSVFTFRSIANTINRIIRFASQAKILDLKMISCRFRYMRCFVYRLKVQPKKFTK